MKEIDMKFYVEIAFLAIAASQSLYGGVFGEAKRIEGSFDRCMAVCIEGKTLYAGEGPSVVVYDVCEPLSPRRCGKVDGLGAVRQIAAQDGMLYVTTREYGLWIIDATKPSSPRIRSRFDCCELATGVDVAGNVCFVGQRQNGVEFIDVSDPDNTAHIAMRKTDESQSVKYCDGVLYSGEWGTGKLTVFDAADMRNIREPARLDLLGYGDGVWVKGNFLYASTGHHAKHRDLSKLPMKGVDTAETRKYGGGGPGAGCGHGLDIFDISEPSAPKRIGRADFPPFYARGLDMWTPRTSANSSYVFCAATHNGLFAVDCRDPAAPKVVDRWVSPVKGKTQWPSACVGSVAVGNGCVYVPTMVNGLFVIPAEGAATETIERGKAPVNADYREQYETDGNAFHVWRPSAVGQARGLAVRGDYVFAACGDAGFHVLKMDEKKGFSEVANNLSIPKIYDVAICGDRLYTAEGLSGWGIYRFTGETGLEEIGRLRDIGNNVRLALNVWAVNGRLSAFSARMSGVTFFDVSDPKNPIRQCNVQGCPGWDKYLMDAPIGNGRYLAYNSAHTCIRWIDVAANPAFVASMTDRNRITLSNGICRFSDDLALVTSNDGYLFLGPNEGDPVDGSLWKAKPFPGAKRFRGIPRADGSLVALTARITRQIALYDFSDRENPVQLGYWQVSGNPDLAVFWKGRMLIPCGYQGVLMQK